MQASELRGSRIERDAAVELASLVTGANTADDTRLVLEHVAARVAEGFTAVQIAQWLSMLPRATSVRRGERRVEPVEVLERRAVCRRHDPPVEFTGIRCPVCNLKPRNVRVRPLSKPCESCGVVFDTKPMGRIPKYCAACHRARPWVPMVDRLCEFCGAGFVALSQPGREARFCPVHRHHASRRGG